LVQKLADDNPAVTGYSAILAPTYSNFGNLLSGVGHTDDALAAYGRARTIAHSLVKANPSAPGVRGLLAHEHRSIGNLLFETGKP
jgi:hypothetical protein